jgi:hypothetical protein
MKIVKAVFVLLALFIATPLVSASIVIHVENKAVPFEQGSTGNSLSVYAYTTTTDGADRFLNGYILGFDLTGSGKGVLSGFSNFTATSYAPFSSTFEFQSGLPEFDNFDFLVSADDSASPNTVNLKNHTSIATAFKLFDLNFNIGSVPPGVYTGGFIARTDAKVDGSPINDLTINGNSTSSFVASGGNFTVNGQEVPEPTTITLLAIGLAGGVACRRFRKRSSSVGPGTTDPSTNEAKV